MQFLVVDFEFSVYSSNTYGRPRAWFPEIIEVGAVLTDERGRLTGKTYSTFVKPRFFPRLTEECYSITGIKQQDVDNGVPLEEALAKLREMAGDGEVWLVAWGDADRTVLSNVCERYGLEYPFVWEDYIDLATAYRDFTKRTRRASLKTALEEMNVEQVGISHSAMDDAINAALIMEKMLQSGWKAERAANPTPDKTENGTNRR